jgi:predicted metal-dependent phosphoesterase TrpH
MAVKKSTSKRATRNRKAPAKRSTGRAAAAKTKKTAKPSAKKPKAGKSVAKIKAKTKTKPKTAKRKAKTKAPKPKAKKTAGKAVAKVKAKPKSRSKAKRPVIRIPRPAPPKPRIIPASTPEAYRDLEETLYQVRDAVEVADSFADFRAQLAVRRVPEERVRRACDLSIGGDLHLHTTTSDGKIPARKLPWVARAMGLETIAITDHDSVSGCREAFREGTLIGVRAIAGVELSTEQSGLEILTYFPEAGKLFSFLDSSKSERFRKVLKDRQETMHAKSLACLDHVNAWLRRQKVPAENLITLEEYDAWFGGQKPYFPGTLCVLGLARLSAPERERLKIRDPRTFHTRVATPFLKAWDARHVTAKSQARLKEAFAIVKAAARAGVPAATFVAHPKELMTKGKMSLGAAGKLVVRLAEEYGLDGIEVACSRDTADDVRYWTKMVEEYNATVEDVRGSKRRKPLLSASHGSDFHVLAPGRATGEITLGFGVLDQRPQYRRGNLRPQMALPEFMDLLRRRARNNATL